MYGLSLFQNGLFHAAAAAALSRHREGILGLGVPQETLDAVGPVVAATAGLLPGQVHGLVHLGDGRRRQEVEDCLQVLDPFTCIDSW